MRNGRTGVRSREGDRGGATRRGGERGDASIEVRRGSGRRFARCGRARHGAGGRVRPGDSRRGSGEDRHRRRGRKIHREPRRSADGIGASPRDPRANRMGKRVALTGLGVITPIGTGKDAFWTGLMEGRSGVRRITAFDPTPYDTQIAGEIPGFDPTQFMDRKEVRRNDRFVQLALAATRLALDDSGFAITPRNADRVGVIIGSGIDAPEGAVPPFEAGRDGFVMGEGAGIVLLEEWEHAERRGARIYAEMAGYGTSADAYHITQPDPEGDGAARAIQLALRDAGVEPRQVGYINAHGTSTPYNDRLETLAIKRVWGDHARSVPISSTKSMTSHLLGAAGGVEAVACALAIERGILPPTINYEVPDPECDLDYIPNTPRRARVDVAMSNAFGFGGHNAILVLRRPA